MGSVEKLAFGAGWALLIAGFLVRDSIFDGAQKYLLILGGVVVAAGLVAAATV